MRIIYIAKHEAVGNEDEFAVAYALRELGHEVVEIQEDTVSGMRGTRVKGDEVSADLLLFHKWSDTAVMDRFKMRKVFWYFDLVDYPKDPSLLFRNNRRKRWMNEVLPHVDLGFCTDGEWVERAYTSGGATWENYKKLVWLPQGFDSRLVQYYRNDQNLYRDSPGEYQRGYPILFTGIGRLGGKERASFVTEMQGRYGDKFQHVESGLHGKNLSDAVCRSQIIVAPDSPISSKYWSNRVYLTLGLGGFLLHPYCENLSKDYLHGEDLVYYGNRDQLHQMIGEYLRIPEECSWIADSGRRKTLQHHTYTHRCARLLEIVKERLS